MSTLITAEYFNEQMATLGLKRGFSMADSPYFDTLITEASDWVENYCDRIFEEQDVTESLYGPVRGSKRLLLNHFPINSVASAYYEDDLGQTGALDVSKLRALQGGILEWKTQFSAGSLYSGAWYNNVYYTVTYNTGYDPVPSNVQRATALKIAVLLQPQYQGPQEREIFMVTNLEALIIDLLEPYRRERLG